jgi:hypothetical protein
MFFFYYVDPGDREVSTPHFWLKQLTGLCGGALLFYLLSQTVPEIPKNVRLILAACTVIAFFIYGRWLSKPGHRGGPDKSAAFRVSAVIAVLAAFVFPVVAICIRAHGLGVQASENNVCGPIQFFGLPLIDVETRDVTINWHGANWPTDAFGSGPRPQPLGALLVAEDSSTVTVLAPVGGANRVLRLNAASISIRYPPPTHSSGQIAAC